MTDTLKTSDDLAYAAADAEETIDPNAPREVTFDADLLDRLTAEIDRLNKLAGKLRVDPIAFEITGKGTRKKAVEGYYLTEADLICGAKVPTVDIDTLTATITGATPMLPGGWKFLGSVEFLTGDGEENGALVHGDDERLATYRDAGPVCDHCKLDRRRKKIVVLEDDKGALTVVGSSCLKDFLGYHGNPERVLNFFDEVGGMIDDLDGYGRFARAALDVPTDTFLGMAAAMVREFGWVAKSAYSGWATAYRVSDRFFPPTETKHNRDYLAENNAVLITKADEAKAAAAKTWVKDEAETKPGNNYIVNLKVLTGGSWIVEKHFGLAASLIGAYDRAMGVKLEWELKKAADEKAKVESEWVGEIGKRIEFTAIVTFVHTYETDYGTSRIVSMVDGNGSKLKTFTSGRFAYGIKVGDVVTGKGTVKNFETYKEVKETVLARVAATVTTPSTDDDGDDDGDE